MSIRTSSPGRLPCLVPAATEAIGWSLADAPRRAVAAIRRGLPIPAMGEVLRGTLAPAEFFASAGSCVPSARSAPSRSRSAGGCSPAACRRAPAAPLPGVSSRMGAMRPLSETRPGGTPPGGVGDQREAPESSTALLTRRTREEIACCRSLHGVLRVAAGPRLPASDARRGNSEERRPPRRVVCCRRRPAPSPCVSQPPPRRPGASSPRRSPTSRGRSARSGARARASRAGASRGRGPRRGRRGDRTRTRRGRSGRGAASRSRAGRSCR